MPPKYLKIARKNPHTNSSRCSECKNTIHAMVREVCGVIKIEHKLLIPARLSDFSSIDCYSMLKKVYDALVSFRGFKDYVKAQSLSNCDIYVSSKDYIIELDENQHFSEARMVSLQNYPSSISLGFDKLRWIKECSRVNAKDPTPPYRDEQRAWYDTIRDFLPLIDGSFKPTVRIMLSATQWCALDPGNPKDVNTFRRTVGL